MTSKTRTGSSVWKRVTVGALVGMVLVHLVATIRLEGEYPLFALVIELPLLALASLVASGRRWVAVFAAIVAGLMATVTAANQFSDPTVYDAPELFAFLLLFVGLGVVVVIAGLITARKDPIGRAG